MRYNVYTHFTAVERMKRMADTHIKYNDHSVLVNDPSSGYGIFIENMLEAAR